MTCLGFHYTIFDTGGEDAKHFTLTTIRLKCGIIKDNFLTIPYTGRCEIAKLEEVVTGSRISGITSGENVEILAVKWYGSNAIEVTYKNLTG